MTTRARTKTKPKPERRGCALNIKSLLPTLAVLHSLLCILMIQSAALFASAHLLLDQPARITIQPNDLIAVEGESTELNCDAEGEPEPTIEWYHNGQLIKSSSHSRTTMGGSIQFLDIRPPNSQQVIDSSRSSQLASDAGIYHCLARNSLGEARSRNATLQVAYINEEFKVAPVDKLAAIGDTVTFDCLPQAWPEPTIRWRHNGRLIEPNEFRLADGSAKYSINKIARTDLNIPAQPQNSLGTNMGPSGGQMVDLIGSQLVIKQADKNDEGTYSCLVETKGTHRLIERESPSARLSALVKPYFIESPEHTTVQVGGHVRLKCRMGGDPEPVISWRKQNGQPLSEKTQIDPADKTLILDQVTVADQANYVCEGENPLGSAQTMATVSVYSRPKFTIHPTDQEVDPGGKVQIRCAGEASPAPMLFWYKEGHRQLMFAPSSSSSKKHPSLDWNHAAALVSSDYRYGHSSDISPAANKLFSMPASADQVQLVNTGYGNIYFGNRIFVDNQGTLNIVNATTSDNGYYACALISSVGAVLAKAKVNVKSPLNSPASASEYYDPLLSQDPTQPRIGKFDLLPPPVIKFGAANQTLPVNTSATLVCEVVSQVAYKIQWVLDSQPLQEQPPRVVILDTGALSISPLKMSDSGVYTCVVTAANDQSMPLAAPFEPLDSSMLTSAPPVQQSTSHSTTLKIASPMNPNIQFYKMDPFAYPSSPGPAYVVSTNGMDALTIAWKAPDDSGSLPIKEYVVEHYDTSQEHLGWRVIYRVKGRESLLIDGLSADGSHFFVIRAANSHGTGPSSAIAGPMRTVAGDKRFMAETQRRRMSPDGRNKIDPSSFIDPRSEANLARERLMIISTNLLTLTPASSTSIRLQWAIVNSSGPSSEAIGYPMGGVDDFLEGYSIRYRAIGIGESLLGKDPFSAPVWQSRDLNVPASLPLVTSYIEDKESLPIRNKREVGDPYEHSQEFNEIRVADHNIEHYTINGLRPFTQYQFFVVPYYKDIDGVPSNILTAQTNEDRPSIAPPNLTIRPINNTAVRLLWLHIPSIYTNGILRGYVVRLNRSDVQQTPGSIQIDSPKILSLPLGSLNVAQIDNQDQLRGSNFQRYVVMHDITDLNYKSFYSVQVAGTTSVGSGPLSEPQNFIMDPQVLASQSGSEFGDVLAKSIIPNSMPQAYSSTGSGLQWIFIICIILVSVLLVIGLLLYRRNNQRVLTWKKTISEHFTNKFYMPSTVDQGGPISIPQNIYDHQQHLIYSGSTHLVQPPSQAHGIWSNNNCVNSSGTGSLSSHGGLTQVNNDPDNTSRRINGDRMLVMNKDNNPGFLRGNQATLIGSQRASDTLHQNQIVQHGSDYYSVINNAAEYEELDNQQRSQLQQVNNSERIQTASSNSDTSCPSSVTRLLPNQPYNRDLLSRRNIDNAKYEMILQQQVAYNGGKQPFVTMVNGEQTLMSMAPLSPYATTNLMNQVSASPQIFANQQMIDQSRHQNFIMHNGGSTMDDSSRILMNHQQTNGVQNQISSFRTLQRNPLNFQTSRGQPVTQVIAQQLFASNEVANNARFQAQINNSSNQFGQMPQQISTNISVNPLMDVKSNLYEHIDYLSNSNEAQQQQQQYHQNNHHPTMSNEIISSSTSSGSVRSPPSQNSPDQIQLNPSKFRRGSANTNFDNESHDLRVFSTQQRHEDVSNERRRLNGSDNGQSTENVCDDGDIKRVDETTAFKQPLGKGDEQRTRQLSKRRRQQQRNRLHNNNQKIG